MLSIRIGARICRSRLLFVLLILSFSPNGVLVPVSGEVLSHGIDFAPMRSSINDPWSIDASGRIHPRPRSIEPAMSFTPLDDDADSAWQILLHSYFGFVSIAFLYYDHIITLGNEITFIWRRKKTGSTWMFFTNRYLAFVSNIAVTILSMSPLTPAGLVAESFSCKHYNFARQLLLLVGQSLVGFLLTLRIYALYSCNKRILIFMVTCGAILISLSCWSLLGQNSDPAQPSTGCHIALSKDTAIHLAVAWEALFVYDTLIMFMTMAKTYMNRRVRASVPLLWLIFRDGAIFFGVMALANLANILTFYKYAGPFLRGGLSTFASCISAAMMSRLMLNLHQVADSGISTMGHQTGTVTDASFVVTSIFAVSSMAARTEDDENDDSVLPQREGDEQEATDFPSLGIELEDVTGGERNLISLPSDAAAQHA